MWRAVSALLLLLVLHTTNPPTTSLTGYGSDDDTWEPAANISPELIADFEEQRAAEHDETDVF